MGGKQHTKVVGTYMKVSVSQIKPFITLPYREMTTKEKMIEDILERLKDYEDDTGIIEIGGNQLRLLLKEYLQDQPTYEQGFERGKQVGYKEGWRDKSTEEREVEISNYDLLGCTKCGYIPYKCDRYCSKCGIKIKRLD